LTDTATADTGCAVTICKKKLHSMIKKDSLVGMVHQITGLSLRSLADFTGTPQSLLSRYGQGNRGLPGDTLLLLAKFLRLASGLNEIPAHPPTAAEQAGMKEQAHWCRIQCLPLKKKLAAMKENYRQATTALRLLEAHEKEEGLFEGKKKRWLDEQRFVAEKKMGNNSLMKQKELAVKIALLQTEAKLWEEDIVQINEAEK
jgi:hypothetical protein